MKPKLSIGQEKLLKAIVNAAAFGVSCPGFCERGKSAGWYGKANALVRKGLARVEMYRGHRTYYRTPAGIDYVNGVEPETEPAQETTGYTGGSFGPFASPRR